MIGGEDNDVELGSDCTLVRRRRHAEETVLTVAREADLLAIVGRVSPLPVPKVVDVMVDDDAMVMERLDGQPLLDVIERLDKPAACRIGYELGRLLASLHRLELDAVRGVVPVEPSPLQEFHQDAVRIVDAVTGELPRALTASIARFVASPVPSPARRRRLCHNDLGAEHVLVEGRTYAITGVIDWSDASISDPALDLGLVWRDLGEAAFEAARAHVSPYEDMTTRALYYARVKALEDFEYGLTTGRGTYQNNAVRALHHLFAR